jgi:hypothetical protein
MSTLHGKIAFAKIAAVAAEAQPPPSGKSQQRMLAWLVADAGGATALLGHADATLAGKRLDYQAKRVRQSLQAAADQASTDSPQARLA